MEQSYGAFGKLWQYRGFVLGTVKRDFQQRYFDSVLGAAWTVLNPLAMIFIYTVVFSRVMRTRLAGLDDTLAYSIFLCAGVFAWNYFVETMNGCVGVFVSQSNLLKKSSFPRITLPVSILLTATANYAIVLGLFLVAMIISGRFTGLNLLGMIPLLAVQQMIALGMGMLLGTLNVLFRDVGQFTGIVLQFWFWLTPIVYPIHILPEYAQELVLSVNPLASIMTGYQQIMLEGTLPNVLYLWYPAALGFAAMGLGLLVYKRLAPHLVDEL